MISSVSNGTISKDVRVSFNWAVFDAPRITVLTLGFFKHHAIANFGIDVFSLSARSFNWLIFFRFSSTSHLSFNQPRLSMPKRVSVGFALLYFPDNSPEASGLQIVVPMPKFRKSIR